MAPDIMGLRPLFDDLCDRLAVDNGWAVCAPEPFPGREELPISERDIGSNDDDTVLGDLVAAADVLDVEPVGILGFCQGGMWAFKAAGTGRFDRAISFYGMVRVRWARPGHAQPLEYLARPARVPVLAIAGGHDRVSPPEDLDALAGIPGVEVVVYPEAEHGFVHDPSRPTHRPADAADVWRRAITFLSA